MKRKTGVKLHFRVKKDGSVEVVDVEGKPSKAERAKFKAIQKSVLASLQG